MANITELSIGIDGKFTAEYDDGSVSIGSIIPSSIVVPASRFLTAADDGATLDCTNTLTLTIPSGLPSGFGVAVITNGTTTISKTGGVTLNGGTADLTRAQASNVMFAIVNKKSSTDSYVVTGS